MEIKDLYDKIINANCLDILKQLPDKCIDLVLTDPPYEVDSLGGISQEKGLGKRANKLRDSIRFVADGFDYENIFKELIRVCKIPNMYLFCSNKQISKIMSYFEEKGYSTTLLTWLKTNAIPVANGKYHSNTEYIICVRDKGACFNNVELSKKSKVISMPYPQGNRIHPIQKPVALIQRLLEIKSNPNDLN